MNSCCVPGSGSLFLLIFFFRNLGYFLYLNVVYTDLSDLPVQASPNSDIFHCCRCATYLTPCLLQKSWLDLCCSVRFIVFELPLLLSCSHPLISLTCWPWCGLELCAYVRSVVASLYPLYFLALTSLYNPTVTILASIWVAFSLEGFYKGKFQWVWIIYPIIQSQICKSFTCHLYSGGVSEL